MSQCQSTLARLPLYTFLLVFIVGCASDEDMDEVNDSADNCPEIANPNQNDADSDGIGDACDVVVVAMGDSDESVPHLQVPFIHKMPPRPPGVFTIANGTDQSIDWELSAPEDANWISYTRKGSVPGSGIETVHVDLMPEKITSDHQTDVILTVGEDTYQSSIAVQSFYPDPQECVYLVTLTSITVVARQNLARDGLALEPFVDLNAVGLARYRSPPRGNHVIRAGQTIKPNVLFAMQWDKKDNAITQHIIADVDEIDGPQAINPDDLRQQGQSGNTVFNFDCDNGRVAQIINVPVIGNVLGEGNGQLDIEVEIQWDP